MALVEPHLEDPLATSLLHNAERLVKGPKRCTLLVHPDDAARWRLRDGGSARVTSERGSVEVTGDSALVDALAPYFVADATDGRPVATV